MRRWALAALVLVACSSRAEEPPTPPPVEVRLGTFRVSVAPEPLRIVVAGPDGRVLFDGLPPKSVPTGDEENDPPPITGLAVREVTTKVQALYGSYQFTDTSPGWRVARFARDVRASGEGLSFDAYDETAKIASVTVRLEAEGELSLRVLPAIVARPGARTWTSIAARCDDDDRFLGFGAQARDVEHRGTVVPIFVSEPGIGKRDDDAPIAIWYIAGTRHASSFPVPLYLARRGYVGALDVPGRSVFGMCAEENALRITGDSDAASDRTFSFRIFAGKPKEALARSTSRFGRPRVPPRLAFAPWNDAIFGTEAVRAFAKYLRDKDVPSSAIWSEDWRGGRFVGDDYKLEEEWDLDRTLYPDFEKLVAELHDQGFAMFTYFNTFVEKDNSVWKEAQPKGHLVAKQDGAPYTFAGVKQKETGMVDLTKPAAKAFMIGKMKSALALGVDGWMGDYGEWLPLDAKLGDGSDPWATHNLYPELWTRAQREALDADDVGGAAPPKERRLAFVRSGFLRSAPYADVVWAGDQATDMSEDDGLPTIVPMGLGLGIAGISTYGHDIAGYQVALRKPTDKETFFRWTELGAWSPVMRTHHGTQPKKNWMLQSDEESTQHFRRYAIVHQQLLPLWELLAKEANQTGISIWRHLAVEFPDDAAAWAVGDEVMIGSAILVAPVTTKGATSRKVYFPRGARWVPWAGGARIEGGETRDVAAPLAEIPVFVREGAIVPQLPDRVRTVIPEAKGVVRVEDVGDDRVILAVAGAASRTVETSGLEYLLVRDEGAKQPTWNGAPLSSCGAAPCTRASESGRVIAEVVGAGELASSGWKLLVKGGAPTRKLLLELRTP